MREHLAWENGGEPYLGNSFLRGSLGLLCLFPDGGLAAPTLSMDCASVLPSSPCWPMGVYGPEDRAQLWRGTGWLPAPLPPSCVTPSSRGEEGLRPHLSGLTAHPVSCLA